MEESERLNAGAAEFPLLSGSQIGLTGTPIAEEAFAQSGRVRSARGSKFRGVQLVGQLWRAVLLLKSGDMQDLGSFKTEEEAAREYDKEVLRARKSRSRSAGNVKQAAHGASSSNDGASSVADSNADGEVDASALAELNYPEDTVNPTSSSDDGHDESCTVCKAGGVLLMCDGCPRCFHYTCVRPFVTGDLPDDVRWLCPACELLSGSRPSVPCPRCDTECADMPALTAHWRGVCIRQGGSGALQPGLSAAAPSAPSGVSKGRRGRVGVGARGGRVTAHSSEEKKGGKSAPRSRKKGLPDAEGGGESRPSLLPQPWASPSPSRCSPEGLLASSFASPVLVCGGSGGGYGRYSYGEGLPSSAGASGGASGEAFHARSPGLRAAEGGVSPFSVDSAGGAADGEGTDDLKKARARVRAKKSRERKKIEKLAERSALERYGVGVAGRSDSPGSCTESVGSTGTAPQAEGSGRGKRGRSAEVREGGEGGQPPPPSVQGGGESEWVEPPPQPAPTPAAAPTAAPPAKRSKVSAQGDGSASAAPPPTSSAWHTGVSVYPGGARVREAPTADFMALLQADHTLTATLAALAAHPAVAALLGRERDRKGVPGPGVGAGEASSSPCPVPLTEPWRPFVRVLHRAGGWYAHCAVHVQGEGGDCGPAYTILRAGRWRSQEEGVQAGRLAWEGGEGEGRGGLTTAGEGTRAPLRALLDGPFSLDALPSRLSVWCPLCSDTSHPHGTCEGPGCGCALCLGATSMRTSLQCASPGCSRQVHSRCFSSRTLTPPSLLSTALSSDPSLSRSLGWTCGVCVGDGQEGSIAVGAGSEGGHTHPSLLSPTEAAGLLAAAIDCISGAPPAPRRHAGRGTSVAAVLLRMPQRTQKLLCALLLTASVKYTLRVLHGDALPLPGSTRVLASPFAGLERGGEGEGEAGRLTPPPSSGGPLHPTPKRPPPSPAHASSIGCVWGGGGSVWGGEGAGGASPWHVPMPGVPPPPPPPAQPYRSEYSVDTAYAESALRALFACVKRGRGVMAVAGIPARHGGPTSRHPVYEVGQGTAVDGPVLTFARAAAVQPIVSLYDGYGGGVGGEGKRMPQGSSGPGRGGEGEAPPPTPDVVMEGMVGDVGPPPSHSVRDKEAGRGAPARGVSVGGPALLRDRLQAVLATRPGLSSTTRAMTARMLGGGGGGDGGGSSVFKTSPFRTGNGGALALAVAAHHGQKRGGEGEEDAGGGAGGSSTIGTGVADLLYPVEHRLMDEMAARRRIAIQRSLARSVAIIAQAIESGAGAPPQPQASPAGAGEGSIPPPVAPPLPPPYPLSLASQAHALDARHPLALPLDTTMFIGLGAAFGPGSECAASIASTVMPVLAAGGAVQGAGGGDKDKEEGEGEGEGAAQAGDKPLPSAPSAHAASFGYPPLLSEAAFACGLEAVAALASPEALAAGQEAECTALSTCLAIAGGAGQTWMLSSLRRATCLAYTSAVSAAHPEAALIHAERVRGGLLRALGDVGVYGTGMETVGVGVGGREGDVTVAHDGGGDACKVGGGGGLDKVAESRKRLAALRRAQAARSEGQLNLASAHILRMASVSETESGAFAGLAGAECALPCLSPGEGVGEGDMSLALHCEEEEARHGSTGLSPTARVTGVDSGRVPPPLRIRRELSGEPAEARAGGEGEGPAASLANVHGEDTDALVDEQEALAAMEEDEELQELLG